MKEKKYSRLIAFALAVCMVITFCFCLIPSVMADTKNDITYNDDANYDLEGEENIYEYSFSYSTKSVKEYYISGVPYYFNLDNSLKNTCANVAGTEVLAYYSVYTDTMDGYVAGQVFDDFTWYYSVGSNPKIQDTVQELYTRMETNIAGPGTSEAEFEMGMNSYCSSRGLNIKYTNYVDSSKVNFNSITSALEDNKVFAAFMHNYNIIKGFSDKDNTVFCMREDVKSNHVMMVYGYSERYYYDSHGNLINYIVALDVANGVDTSRTKLFLDHTAGLEELKLIEINN